MHELVLPLKSSPLILLPRLHDGLNVCVRIAVPDENPAPPLDRRGHLERLKRDLEYFFKLRPNVVPVWLSDVSTLRLIHSENKLTAFLCGDGNVFSELQRTVSHLRIPRHRILE